MTNHLIDQTLKDQIIQEQNQSPQKKTKKIGPLKS
jgi:hypothetical protein